MKKLKNNKDFFIYLLIFFIISLISIYSAGTLLHNYDFFYRQIIWYFLGMVLVFIITRISNDFFIKHSFKLYIFFDILLLLLLIVGNPINDAKCWFVIPFIGSFQPSEFMKIVLILFLATKINEFNNKYKKPTLKQEFLFLLNILFYVFIPSILTFLEPDTGVVLIYLLITLIMLFISGIRYRWFVILFSLIFILISFILSLYFLDNDLFINLLGTDFFLRIDRLLDWSTTSGYQLENGLLAIGSAGIIGFGINNTPIYFPEPQTDFIFAIWASNFGFIGGLVLIITIFLFDLKLIKIALKSTNINKLIIGGILGMLIYQQFQNIGMTLGILPITGITLPFISYGGSSLLSYMIIIGFIINIIKK